MLDVDKVVTLSSKHNHRPPHLFRDKNGILVASYMKEDRKMMMIVRNKRGKPTLGPKASRSEVKSLVAKIMKSVNEPKNEIETTNANEVPKPEPEASTSVSNDVMPNLMDIYTSETNKRLKKQRSPTKVSLEFDHANEQPEEKADLLQMSPVKEQLILHEGDSVPLLKHDAGSLVPNQMYIIVPRSETSMIHNRFIIPSQNANTYVYGNRILVSPIKTDVVPPSSQTTQTNQIKTFSNTADSNTVGLNKMFYVLQNESGSIVPRNIEIAAQNEASSSTTNKMFLLVQNKNENECMVTTKARPRQRDDGSESSHENSVTRKEMQTNNNATNSVPCNTRKLQPKKIEMKTSIPMSSIKNITFPSKKPKTGAGLCNLNVPVNNNEINMQRIMCECSLISNNAGTDYVMSSNMQPNKPEAVFFAGNDTSAVKPEHDNVVSSNSTTVLPKIAEPISSATRYVSVIPLDDGHTEMNKSYTTKETQTMIDDCTNVTINDSVNSVNLQSTQQNNTENDSVGSSKLLPKELKNIETDTFTMQSVAIKKTETNYATSSKKVQPKKVETGGVRSSKVPLKKPEYSSSAGSSKVQSKETKKTKTDSAVSSAKHPINENITETGNGVSSKLPKISPQKEPVSFMASYMKALETIDKSRNAEIIYNLAKKSNVVKVLSKTKKTKPPLHNDDNVARKTKKTETPLHNDDNVAIKTKKTRTPLPNDDNVASMTKKTETSLDNEDDDVIVVEETIQTDKVGTIKTEPIVPMITIDDSDESDITAIEKELDLDWIVPKNRKIAQLKKTETDTLSNKIQNDTKQQTDIIHDIKTDFTEILPEIPFAVSMIPLPKDDGPSAKKDMPIISGANENVLVPDEVPPLVMIERLSTKHKSGYSRMSSVPPKKRFYQY